MKVAAANPQEDAQLWAQFQASRDAEVREALVLRYVRLVHFVLNRLGLTSALGPAYEDLVSQGLVGLIEAVDRYDPAFGTQFSTYATLRIRGQVLDSLRSLDWLSRSARRRTREIQQAISQLWLQLRRAPTDEELAEHLKLDLRQMRQALAEADRVVVSLDEMNVRSDDEISLHDLIADGDHADNGDPAEALAEAELKQHLIAALRELPEREQLVLSLYYYEQLTLKEIGAVLNLSESRVCQLHARAVMTLRVVMTAEKPVLAALPLAAHARPLGAQA